MDSPWTINGQLRLGKDSTDKNSIGKYSLNKDNIGKESLNNKLTNNGIMTEQQLLQAVYIENLKDKNANNIIECVSFLKLLPIEVIKIALEKTSLQINPEWNYAKGILNDWVNKGVKNISDIKDNGPYEVENTTIKINNSGPSVGFVRKGDEILNG